MEEARWCTNGGALWKRLGGVLNGGALWKRLGGVLGRTNGGALWKRLVGGVLGRG